MSNNDIKNDDLQDNEKDDQDINQYDLNFKIIIVGDSGVGKSCLAIKAIKNLYEEYYSPTIGFEFLTYNTNVEKKNVKLQIWDTCGQEAYRSLIKSFYRNSSLAILVYSIEKEDSFDNLDKWLNDIKNESSPDIKIVLIGNKLDLESERKITKEKGEKFSKEHKLSFFMETSAKTGFNAKKVFDESGKILFEEYKKLKDKNKDSSLISLSSNNTDTIEQDTENEKRSHCFC